MRFVRIVTGWRFVVALTDDVYYCAVVDAAVVDEIETKDDHPHHDPVADYPQAMRVAREGIAVLHYLHVEIEIPCCLFLEFTSARLIRNRISAPPSLSRDESADIALLYCLLLAVFRFCVLRVDQSHVDIVHWIGR